VGWVPGNVSSNSTDTTIEGTIVRENGFWTAGEDRVATVQHLALFFSRRECTGFSNNNGMKYTKKKNLRIATSFSIFSSRFDEKDPSRQA